MRGPSRLQPTSQAWALPHGATSCPAPTPSKGAGRGDRGARFSTTERTCRRCWDRVGGGAGCGRSWGALSAAPTPGPGGARATRRCSSELLQAELPVRLRWRRCGRSGTAPPGLRRRGLLRATGPHALLLLPALARAAEPRAPPGGGPLSFRPLRAGPCSRPGQWGSEAGPPLRRGRVSHACAVRALRRAGAETR